MNAHDMQDHLQELLDESDDVRSVRSFNDAGVLTSNKGLEVTMNDGSVFQLTIVQEA